MPEGHTIHRLARRHRRLFVGQSLSADSPQGRFADGAALLDGRTLTGTDAWGKHLVHDYGDGLLLHVHLGLFGRFSDGSLPVAPPRGAVRLRLVGEDHWADLRGPTRCEVVRPEELTALVARLGPDPLRSDADPERARRRIARSRAPLAGLLMSQPVVAGVGNVYRSEILYRQGLSPWLAGRDLDPGSWERLWADLVALMAAGVRSGRIVTTQPPDRAQPTGRVRRTDAHYVYRRAGRPCRRCGTTVVSALLAQRTVFWCPACQPDP